MTTDPGPGLDGAGGDGQAAPSVDGSPLPVAPPDFRWTEEQVAGRDMADGRWAITNDQRWTGYMLGDTTFSERVEAGSLGAANEAVQRYLQTGASVGTFTTLPADVGVDGAAVIAEPVPASPPSFGDRLGALPPPPIDIAPVDVFHGDLDHSGTSNVVPLGDGRFAVTLEVDHQWSDRIDPGESFPPGSWQDGASEVLTRGINHPYDLSVAWGESRTIVMDAQGHVYTMEPTGAARA